MLSHSVVVNSMWFPWTVAHQAQKTWLYNWLAFLLFIFFLQVCLLYSGQCFMRAISKVCINGVFLLSIFWLKLIKWRHQQESGRRKEGELMLFTHQPCPFHNILFRSVTQFWHTFGISLGTVNQFRDDVILKHKSCFFFFFNELCNANTKMYTLIPPFSLSYTPTGSIDHILGWTFLLERKIFKYHVFELTQIPVS